MTCGFCVAGNVCVHVVANALWHLTVPFKWIESTVLAVPAVYLGRHLQQHPTALVSSFLVGLALGYGLFVVWADVTVTNASVCTTYLSTVAWCLGNFGYLLVASKGYLPPAALDPPRWTRQRLHAPVITLGETGYLGVLCGLLCVFGKVAFDPNRPETEWHWCRASDVWPAEFVYVPCFLMALLSAYVPLPSTSQRLDEGGSETEMDSL